MKVFAALQPELRETKEEKTETFNWHQSKKFFYKRFLKLRIAVVLKWNVELEWKGRFVWMLCRMWAGVPVTP